MMIHCHDDKQCLILDHERLISDIYAATKDPRVHSNDQIRTNYRWAERFFDVQRPFRTTNEKQKEKKRKRNKKRTHDEAFDDEEQELTEKFQAAVTFCQNYFSKIDRPSNSTQQEYSFNDLPFAQIATEQKQRLPAIRQILLSDYFLRASKLGLQANILYTHDKPHPSIIDTAIAGRMILPARCRFLWSDIENLSILVSEGTKYSFIVLDPPWMNKSVRRKRPYQWSDLDEIRQLPLEQLIDRDRPTLICCWSTNSDRIEEFIQKDLFQKWNCQFLAKWYWLKVTQMGEPVLDLDSMHKKPYEALFLGCAGDPTRFKDLQGSTKIICSVPALIHSVKPPLHALFQDLIAFPQIDQGDRCLEVYARNLLPDFTSIGNEVLKHQSMDLFEPIPSSINSSEQ